MEIITKGDATINIPDAKTGEWTMIDLKPDDENSNGFSNGFDYWICYIEPLDTTYPKKVDEFFKMAMIPKNEDKPGYYPTMDISPDEIYTNGFHYANVDDGELQISYIEESKEDNYLLTFYVASEMYYDLNTSISHFGRSDDFGSEIGFLTPFFASSNEERKLNFTFKITEHLVEEYSETFTFNFSKKINNEKPLIGDEGRFYFTGELNE